MVFNRLMPVRIRPRVTWDFYLDVVGVGEEHAQAIDAHAPACSRRQPVLQRCAEHLIDEHGFVVTLSFGLKRVQHKSLTHTYCKKEALKHLEKEYLLLFVSFAP